MPVITKLIDNSQIGKTIQGTKHTKKGLMKIVELTTYQDFSDKIKKLTAHECFTVGIYPDNYSYVPSQDTQALLRPNTITKTAAMASPGHVLLIDCDHPEFHYLKGKGLHDFLCKYLPDIFDGSGYVATNSTSFYTKGKKAFHQWYIFEHPSDFRNLNTLIDKLFKHHNILTTQIAKNYSRTYVRTPIDTKLHEVQMPIFEASLNRLQILNTNQSLEIEVREGNFIDAQTLHLPNIDTSLAEANSKRVFDASEVDREIKLHAYLEEHGITAHERSKELEASLLPSSLLITNSVTNIETSVLDEILRFVRDGILPNELYQAVGEPTYASHQTAKLMYDDPYALNLYRMIDQAHGGSKYSVTFNYDELDVLFKACTMKEIRNVDALKLLRGHNSLSPEEASLLSVTYKKLFGIAPAKIAKSLETGQTPTIRSLDTEGGQDLDMEDIHTMHAAIDRAKIQLTPMDRKRLDNLIELEQMFNASNISIVKNVVHGVGKMDIMLEPGPKNEFGTSTRSQVVKHLAPLYPPTNISPHADERALDALIEKFTATNKVEDISYKASLHGEKLFFGDGKVEITYQQARPSFMNVPTTAKICLDTMSPQMESEFRDIYVNSSLGYLWPTIAELTYIKKVFPQMKSDFLWINFVSNAGKTFNMDMANQIVPYEKTNLNQLLEQASKINPTSLAKSSFLFHDEVKNFNHNWNELGAFHSLRGMYATSATVAQLPLKVLASAENVMTKGTKQQLNRLMVINDKSKPFDELGLDPKYEAHMMAVSYQVIFEAFDASYGSYANIPEQKALQKATTAAKMYSTKLRPKDMLVTEDYIKQIIELYLIQELVEDEDNTSYMGELKNFIKVYAIKNGMLYVNFKKIDTAKFIEFILKITTSSIEAKSMNYEALNISWKDLGCYNVAKQKTIGGVSGFFGQTLEIELVDIS